MRKYGFLLLLFCGALANAQDAKYKTVDSVLQSYATKANFSGVVLIAEKGKVKYEKVFGYREFAGRIPLEKTDIFELASVSKQFTAMVIMMLKEKGLLQYDDLVEKYLNVPYKGITIRHLLTHTSGLPDYQAVMDEHWDKSKVAGNEDILAYLNKYNPPRLAEPGTKYAYSNTGYVFLASIAEKASGLNFIEFCNKEIFQETGHETYSDQDITGKSCCKKTSLSGIFM